MSNLSKFVMRISNNHQILLVCSPVSTLRGIVFLFWTMFSWPALKKDEYIKTVDVPLFLKWQQVVRSNFVSLYMHILLASDENLIGPLAICLKSISQSHRSLDVQVSVLCAEISEESLDRLSDFVKTLHISVEFIQVETQMLKDVFDKLPQGHVTFGSLLRLLAGSVLPKSVHRIIYIDVDTLVLKSLEELFALDLQGCIAAANVTPHYHLQSVGVVPEKYVNTGVLLIDLDMWRQCDVENKVFAILSEHADLLTYWDQCALNIALIDQFFPMDRTYNYIFTPSIVTNDFEIPHIIHYAGKGKPWRTPRGIAWGELHYEMSLGTPWPTTYNIYMSRTRRLGRRVKAIGRRIRAFFLSPDLGTS